MNIKRLNADFGNSTNNFLFDSYYFEIPTCVVEVTKDQAESYFTNKVDDIDDLIDRLMISTTINEEEKYFLVGKLAEENPYANSHVGKMHNKIKSDIPYVVFLSAVAYYYKMKNPNEENVISVDVDSMKMMLPIWLLKSAEKFSIAQSNMANRFMGEHKVTLMTAGMETDLTINTKKAKCHIESEVSRWALKYKMTNDADENVTKIEKRPEAKKFDDYDTVLVDIGGGSTDEVLLTKGLGTPISKDSFQVIQIDPFLGRLEKLLREKLIEHFSDLRSLEKFIVQNYKEQSYILRNNNNGEKYDLTNPIVDMFKEYARLLVYKVTEPFSSNSKTVVKYVYIGGEAPILKPYIKAAITEMTNEQIMESNHFFLDELLDKDQTEVFQPTARTVNLAALELLSLNETKSNEQ